MYDERLQNELPSGPRNSAPGREKVGVALGSGGARGWSHIGALTALEERGVKPEIVCGASMGALVGAAYATGRLAELEEWARRLTPRRMLTLLDPTLRRGGLMEGQGVVRFLKGVLPDIAIEEMATPYIAVAADLGTGQEIWLKEGSLIEAVRASIALPGVFSPAPRGDQWLVDGGLCNPVPVSPARALGADIVIAVNPNSKLRRRTPGRETAEFEAALEAEEELTRAKGFSRLAPKRLREGLARAISARARARRRPAAPGYYEVISRSMDIMTDRIRASRLAGEPPHVMLQPQLCHLSVLGFYHAAEAIEEGRACVAREEASLATFFELG